MSEAFTLSSALCLALSSMFIGELKGRMSLQLARWQMGATVVMTGGWHTLVPWTFGLLAASSVWGDVGVVSTLAATTPVLSLPMTWIRERKRPQAAAWAGAALVITGTAVIWFG